MHTQKKTFKTIFLYLAILLAILPFILTFNQLLTDLFEKFKLYVWLQSKIVPVQTVLVGLIVRPLRIDYQPFRDGMMVNGLPLKMTWNCLGWQSLLLFGVSLVMGLKGAEYSAFSKIQVVVTGLFGVFWVNLLRLAFIVVLAAWASPIYRYVFHDYLAAIVTVVFLVAFWWFSYSYVLTPSELEYMKGHPNSDGSNVSE